MFSAPPTHPSRSQLFAGAYHRVGIPTMVASATPHGLVALLFDGFVAGVHRAKGALRCGDTAAKCQAIGHAVRIIDEGLRSALDMTGGGKLSTDLADLYSYVCMRLTQANLHSDEAALDECLALMAPLREAWHAIGAQVDGTLQN